MPFGAVHDEYPRLSDEELEELARKHLRAEGRISREELELIDRCYLPRIVLAAIIPLTEA